MAQIMGPINISTRIRGKHPIKMYIAVFVCFTSKAVYLELVTDLFYDCFNRLIARRGLPRTVYSDNATNVIGASRCLKELQDRFNIQNQIFRSVDQANFTLVDAPKYLYIICIPPRAPHFGGLWEAAVKQTKFLLIWAVGNVLLSAEETTTLLAGVEAVPNSRPISELSSDTNDGESLTPAHLLIGDGLRSLPPGSDADVIDQKTKVLEAMANALHTQAAVLKNMVQRLLTKYTGQVQMVSQTTQSTYWNIDTSARGQFPAARVVNRNSNKCSRTPGRLSECCGNTYKKDVFKRTIHKLAAIPIDWRLIVLQCCQC